jgi:hypothetical protein
MLAISLRGYLLNFLQRLVMKTLHSLAIPSALVLMLGLAGCPSQNVHTDYDHNVNFASFHSYSWGTVQTSNPLNVQRIKAAVDPDLQAKGWQLMPTGGDVTVTAVGSAHNQKEYQTFYNGLGGEGYYWGGFGVYGGPGISTTTVQNYKVGTLVLDMYDAKTKHLVWRGTASGGISNNPNDNQQRFNKASDPLLKNFPPK